MTAARRVVPGATYMVTRRTTQRMFLLTLGLAERCQTLLQGASQQEAELIVSGAGRLVNSDQMGQLFKVIALTSPSLAAPPAPSQPVALPA